MATNLSSSGLLIQTGAPPRFRKDLELFQYQARVPKKACEGGYGDGGDGSDWARGMHRLLPLKVAWGPP